MDQPSAADSLPDGKWNRIADLPRSINDLLADVNDPVYFMPEQGNKAQEAACIRARIMD